MRSSVSAIIMALSAVWAIGCTPTESRELMSILQNENAALRQETTALRVENSRLRAQLLGTTQWDGLIQLDRIGSVDAGNHYVRVCPSGEALVGFRGRAGGYIDSMIPVCGHLSTGILDLGDGVSTVRHELDSLGGFGGSSFESLCAAGSYMSGLSGQAAGYIDAIQVVCTQIELETEPSSDDPDDPETDDPEADDPDDPEQTVQPHNVVVRTTRLARIGGTGGTRFERVCPDNWTAVGISGRSGTYINSISILCAQTSHDDPLP